MNVFLDKETSDGEIPDMVTKEISQEEAQMAITLIEYFQAQRQAYDKVHVTLHKLFLAKQGYLAG